MCSLSKDCDASCSSRTQMSSTSWLGWVKRELQGDTQFVGIPGHALVYRRGRDGEARGERDVGVGLSLNTYSSTLEGLQGRPFTDPVRNSEASLSILEELCDCSSPHTASHRGTCSHGTGKPAHSRRKLVMGRQGPSSSHQPPRTRWHGHCGGQQVRIAIRTV